MKYPVQKSQPRFIAVCVSFWYRGGGGGYQRGGRPFEVRGPPGPPGLAMMGPPRGAPDDRNQPVDRYLSGATLDVPCSTPSGVVMSEPSLLAQVLTWRITNNQGEAMPDAHSDLLQIR